MTNRALSTRPEFSPISVIRALWKQKLVVFMTTLLLSSIAVVVIRKLPPVYRAEAMILVENQKISDRYVSSVVNSTVEDRLEAMRREILSDRHVEKIVRDFGLYPELKTPLVADLVTLMRADTEVTLDRSWSNLRTGSFRVAFKGSGPRTVAGVANRIASLFVEENTRLREVQAIRTSDFIETQLAEAKKKLDGLEGALSRYKIQHSGELPEQGNGLSATLSMLQTGLRGNQDANTRNEENKAMLVNTLRVAETEEAMLAWAAARRQAPAVPVIRGGTTVTVPEVGRKSDVLRGQLDVLRGRYSEDHPDVRRARAELESQLQVDSREAERAQQRMLAQQKNKPPDSTPSPTTVEPQDKNPATDIELLRAKERVAQIKLQISFLDKETEARNADRDKILAEIRSYQSRVESLPVREQEISRLTRDYEISKGNYTSLLGKKLSAEMATDMEKQQQAEKFTLLEAATIPSRPFKPNRRVYAAVALAASVGIGLALAFLREWKSDVLLGEWELAGTTTILGGVPRIRALSSPPAGRKPRFRRVAWASALLTIIGIIVAGFYISAHRF
jgi:succinoglycan biosynthesis transport protein ExoP